MTDQDRNYLREQIALEQRFLEQAETIKDKAIAQYWLNLYQNRLEKGE